MGGTPQELMAQYRAAFVHGDVEALVDCFDFPLQVVSIEGDRAEVSIAHGEDWPGLLQGLLGAYQRLSVTDAVPLSLDVSELIEGLAIVRVHWALQRADGAPVYDFAAAYTLGRPAGQLRIIALAHNELPKLRAVAGIR
jgi:hypothetical protein